MVWGTLAGITSFVTHLGAPPALAFLLPQRLPSLKLAGTIVLAFAIGNLAKVPGYWAIGALDDLGALQAGVLVAVGLVGTACGRRIVRVLPDETYRRVLEALLLVLSLLLLTTGLLQIYKNIT